jgi:hypothetical protein
MKPEIILQLSVQDHLHFQAKQVLVWINVV